MQITDIMTPSPITVEPECSLDDAIKLFEQCGFRHLPVMEDGELRGMLSDRDVSLATGWILADYRKVDEGGAPKTVSEIMRSPVFSLSTLDCPEEAARKFVKERIGCLPILNGRKLVGIVTETNLMKAFRLGKLATDLPADHSSSVADCMTTKVVTLDPDAFLEDALGVCTDKGFRHIPIVEKGMLAGMISDRDLRFGMGQEILSDMSAQEVGRLEIARTPLSALMATDVVSVDGRCMLNQAVDVMLNNRFGALPVVSGRALVGILTQTDVLKHCVNPDPVKS